MNAFWDGFEKKASSRMAKELAKHLDGTPKSLTKNMVDHWVGVENYVESGLPNASRIRQYRKKGIPFGEFDKTKYYDKIRDIRDKFRPAKAPRSVPERLGVLRKGEKRREKAQLAAMKKEQETKALAAKNRFFDAIK